VSFSFYCICNIFHCGHFSFNYKSEYFFIAELLFKKKRKGWWMAISIICLACIIPAIIGFKEGWSDEEMKAFVIILLMSLPLLILLLLDRKNFWKVAK
jgi:Na+/melibiose symporter-like transporter